MTIGFTASRFSLKVTSRYAGKLFGGGQRVANRRAIERVGALDGVKHDVRGVVGSRRQRIGHACRSVLCSR